MKWLNSMLCRVRALCPSASFISLLVFLIDQVCIFLVALVLSDILTFYTMHPHEVDADITVQKILHG